MLNRTILLKYFHCLYCHGVNKEQNETINTKTATKEALKVNNKAMAKQIFRLEIDLRNAVSSVSAVCMEMLYARRTVLCEVSRKVGCSS